MQSTSYYFETKKKTAVKQHCEAIEFNEFSLFFFLLQPDINSHGNNYYTFFVASDKYMKPITTNGIHLSPSDLPTVSGEVTVRRMVAMYDYDPQELSPNVDAEVMFAEASISFVMLGSLNLKKKLPAGV